jgi:dihydroflavonol-4-reductase
VIRTLVTGGSGFIGQHLVALLARDRCLRIFDIRPPPCAPPGAQYVKGSVLDAELMREALRNVEEVYHLAGLPGMWTLRRDDFHAVNSRGTEIVIDAARRCGVSRFLHCSTESIFFSSISREPVITEQVRCSLDAMPGAYTRSKLRAEQSAFQAAASGFPVVIANPTMPIGPHHGNLTPPTRMLQHFHARRIQFYLDFILNLVDVRDVAAGLVLAMERGKIGHRYIIGGENISLKKLLYIMATLTGDKARHIPIPAWIAQTAAAILEFVADYVTHRPPAATVEGVRIATQSRALSIDKARRELGYAPRPIWPALRELLDRPEANRTEPI